METKRRRTRGAVTDRDPPPNTGRCTWVVQFAQGDYVTCPYGSTKPTSDRDSAYVWLEESRAQAWAEAHGAARVTRARP